MSFNIEEDIKKTVNKKKIEDYIKCKKLSKTKFCKMCNINFSTLKKILTGKNFNLIALFKIAKVLKVQVKDLINKKID